MWYQRLAVYVTADLVRYLVSQKLAIHMVPGSDPLLPCRGLVVWVAPGFEPP
jgi:hypothetical protein